MAKTRARPYNSPERRRKALETRIRVTDAARALFSEKGYEDAGIDAIARKAGVSSPTIFAIFGSKRGILKTLLENALYGKEHDDLTEKVQSIVDPTLRVRFVATITRQVNDAERSAMTVLKGLSSISTEIAELEAEHEKRRYLRQKATVRFLVDSGRLKRGLTEPDARDILWTLSSRDVYRKLVVDRGWSPARYEAWLAEAIESAVVEKP